AILAPVLFTFVGNSGDVDFLDSRLTICEKVIPLILLPLVAAILTGRISPRTRHAIATHQQLSFYIWAVSLFIVVGRAVTFVMAEPVSMAPRMIIIAVVAGVMCAVQFYIGRRIGNACGDRIAGAQGLGQKNTVLAIWMALSYLNPVSSVGPAAYIAWQNTINSLQLYFKSRKETN
ncbi:MAG: transporter, partial [Duncaniella sp.]|nr:transporter [Duncaniella sp.]